MSHHPLAFLLGTWSGSGHGSYPTIEPFTYAETVVITEVAGKPFLAYRQTTEGEDGRPLHAEVGWWRTPAPGVVELVLAHPSGLVEVLEGHVDGTAIELAGTVVTTTSAKDVSATRRTFSVDADRLTYEVAMAAVGTPLTHHLAASLRRA